MQTIADLFTYVYEKRKREKAAKAGSANGTTKSLSSSLGASGSNLNVTPAVSLSFSPAKGEEFSEDKVNEAWNSTVPVTNEIVGGGSSPNVTGLSAVNFNATASTTASPSLSMVSGSGSILQPATVSLPPPPGAGSSNRNSSNIYEKIGDRHSIAVTGTQYSDNVQLKYQKWDPVTGVTLDDDGNPVTMVKRGLSNLPQLSEVSNDERSWQENIAIIDKMTAALNRPGDRGSMSAHSVTGK